MLVKELMTKNVITVSPEASLKDVGKILKEKKISGVPVVNDAGRVVGVITITDLLRILGRIYQWREMEKGKEEMNLSEMYEQEKEKAKVKDVMTKDVVSLSEEDTLDDVMRMMFENKVHTIPVMKDNQLIGVIGKRDLLYACF
ncbi:MAG: CBS domain-containing protein [Candidatus Omnitrophota bacterium]